MTGRARGIDRVAGAAAPTLAAALLLDLLAGEPPPTFHPVVWMGRLLTWLEPRAPAGPAARLVFGGVVGLGAPLLWGTLGWLVERHAPWPVQALALKPTFAGRALLEAGRSVEHALRDGNLALARQRLRSLVSRPTEELDASLVRAAAIESLAENFSDSWVAPLLAYALFGLPGAYAYRAINTADAMWGYRSPTYLWLGKVAARLDDLVNWLPARLAGLCLVTSSPAPREAARIWRRDGGRTASPNAGQPMAAAAGALGLRLEKVGHYALNEEGPLPAPDDLTRTRGLVGRAMVLAAACAIVLGLRRARG